MAIFLWAWLLCMGSVDGCIINQLYATKTVPIMGARGIIHGKQNRPAVLSRNGDVMQIWRNIEQQVGIEKAKKEYVYKWNSGELGLKEKAGKTKELVDTWRELDKVFRGCYTREWIAGQDLYWKVEW